MKSHLLALSLFLAFGANARADITLPFPQGDSMVLQRDMPVRVWGAAAPEARVSVAFGGKTVATNADKDGKWSLRLPAMEASDQGRELIATETTPDGKKSSKTLRDILVGEVWLTSGQSNAWWALDDPKVQGGHEASQQANDPNLRLICVKDSLVPFSPTPITQEIAHIPWAPANPQSTASQNRLGPPAFGYFFAAKLRKELRVPVGLIKSAYGGSRIAAWMPAKEIGAFPRYAKDLVNIAKPGAKLHENCVTVLYNSLISPLTPYTIRGVIWYQGERDGKTGNENAYPEELRRMVTSWREAWEAPDMPFFYAQVAPCDMPYYGGHGAGIRDAQRRAKQDITNSGMIVLSDLADNKNPAEVHPPYKREAGERMASLVLSKVYGKNMGVVESPEPLSVTREGAALRVRFSHAEGLRTRDGKPPTGFEIAGSDGNFVPAEGVIEKVAVKITAPGIASPASVRFAWKDFFDTNLVNSGGLPASTFGAIPAK